MDARIAKLMRATAQRFAALAEHTFKVVAAMIDSNAVTRLTVTALPAVAPEIPCTGALFFFHFASPQDTIAARRTLPRAISISDAARALIGFASPRPHVAARVSTAAIQILNAGHAHTTPWLARSDAAGQMQGAVLFPRATAVGTWRTTAVFTNQADRAVAGLNTVGNHALGAMTNSITGTMSIVETGGDRGLPSATCGRTWRVAGTTDTVLRT